MDALEAARRLQKTCRVSLISWNETNFYLPQGSWQVGLLSCKNSNKNDLSNLSILGYIPGAEALTAVATLAKKLHEANPDLIYLLDRKFTYHLNNSLDTQYLYSCPWWLWQALCCARCNPDISEYPTPCHCNNTQLVRSRVRFRS